MFEALKDVGMPLSLGFPHEKPAGEERSGTLVEAKEAVTKPKRLCRGQHMSTIMVPPILVAGWESSEKAMASRPVWPVQGGTAVWRHLGALPGVARRSSLRRSGAERCRWLF